MGTPKSRKWHRGPRQSRIRPFPEYPGAPNGEPSLAGFGYEVDIDVMNMPFRDVGRTQFTRRLDQRYVTYS
ncbi:hypothetical protein CCUS01_02758 [Colletotrichum cuscutae]|uniref:Uncharacterized protein n=1 Tax=Colletotrichum cuscutae TaxID=1209917 RepID=A0AAJ0DNX9_9PEZI|nr:hypothetical protein CCUS01_02758 [Colletotrichum cuscutae]